MGSIFLVAGHSEHLAGLGQVLTMPLVCMHKYPTHNTFQLPSAGGDGINNVYALNTEPPVTLLHNHHHFAGVGMKSVT